MMRGMRWLAAAAIAWPASATAADVEIDPSLSLTGLAGGFDQAIGPEEVNVVGRATAWLDVTSTFRNGLRLGATFGVAAERDNPLRDPRGGRIGDCPVAVAVCPSAEGRPVRSYFSGFYTAGPEADRDGRFALEAAYLSLRGGYGEISLGRDEGMASRFSLPPPSVLPAGDPIQGSLDPTGLSGVQTLNDVSGPSAKLTALTPRLLGVRLGLSYTPRLEARGTDQGYLRGADQPLTADPRNILEAGASFERTWANGLRTSLSGSYASGGDRTGLAAFERLQAWSLGGRLEHRGWSIGANRLSSDNGWALGPGGYRSITAGAVREKGRWAVMLSGARARDDLARARVSAVTAGARYEITDALDVSGGVSGGRRLVPVALDGQALDRRETSIGAFAAFSWRL